MKIGILKFEEGLSEDKKYIIPTKLIGKQSWSKKPSKEQWPLDNLGKVTNDFYWGNDKEVERLHSIERDKLYKFKGFKADLKLSSFKDRNLWNSEIWDFTELKPTVLPNPKILSEVYLQILSKRVLNKLELIFENDPNYEKRNKSFLISTPAYEKDTTGYRLSDTFKKNLREIQNNIRKNLSDEKILWPQATDSLELMYEQYGIFYYYRFINPIVKSGRSKSLIIDIGGSTTDLALISYIEDDRPYPVPPKVVSIDFGGSVLNRRILEKIHPSFFRINANNSKKQFEVLEKVESAKLDILTGKIKTIRIEDKELNEIIIKDVFIIQWKKYVLPKLKAFLNDTVGENDEVENLLLAGGGALMPGLNEILLSDTEVRSFLLNAKVIAVEQEKHEPTSFASLGYAALQKVLKEPGIDASNLLPQTSITLFGWPCQKEGGKIKKLISNPIVIPLELRSENIEGINRQIYINEIPNGFLFDVKTNGDNSQELKTFVDLRLFNQSNAIVDSNGQYIIDLKIDEFVIRQNYNDQQVSFTPIFTVRNKGNKVSGTINKNLEESLRSFSIKHIKHKNDQDISICIDFGMTNTCISITIPDDFQLSQSNEHIDIIDINTSDNIKLNQAEINKSEVIKKTDIGFVQPNQAENEPIVEGSEIIDNGLVIHLDNEESVNSINTKAELIPSVKKELLENTTNYSFDKKNKQIQIEPKLINECKIKNYNELYSQFKKVLTNDSDYEDNLLKIIAHDIMKGGNVFTILAGPPGSGKSSLISKVASILNADLQNIQDVYYFKSISPVLFSISDLYIENDYKLVRFLIFANHNPHRKFIICFDEMNLNHPEYYLSDFISCMDGKNQIHFEGFTFTISDNIKIFGTINTDLTTKPLSPKMIDRVKLLTVKADKKKMIEKLLTQKELVNYKSLFEKIADTLEVANLSISYRVVNNINSFVAEMKTEIQGKDLIDQILTCYLLPRFPGFSQFMHNQEEYMKGLKEIKTLLDKDKLMVSSQRVNSIINGFSGQEIM
jgi:hypothetical protein